MTKKRKRRIISFFDRTKKLFRISKNYYRTNGRLLYDWSTPSANTGRLLNCWLLFEFVCICICVFENNVLWSQSFAEWKKKKNKNVSLLQILSFWFLFHYDRWIYVSNSPCIRFIHAKLFTSIFVMFIGSFIDNDKLKLADHENPLYAAK